MAAVPKGELKYLPRFSIFNNNKKMCIQMLKTCFTFTQTANTQPLANRIKTAMAVRDHTERSLKLKLMKKQ